MDAIVTRKGHSRRERGKDGKVSLAYYAKGDRIKDVTKREFVAFSDRLEEAPAKAAPAKPAAPSGNKDGDKAGEA